MRGADGTSTGRCAAPGTARARGDGRRPDRAVDPYAGVVGNIGKEVRRIEVLPVPEPPLEPVSPERPQPPRDPSPVE
ncbi:hypothetical protein GCM10027261_23550 [Geodermatophilus arenarius]